MSDEHNKPENSTVAKPRSRRPATKKSPAESAGAEKTNKPAVPAETSSSSAPEAPKPAKPRAPRRKSTTTKAAASTGEVSPGDDKTPSVPKKPARPARKSTPKSTSPSTPKKAAADAAVSTVQESAATSVAGEAQKNSRNRTPEGLGTARDPAAPLTPPAINPTSEAAADIPTNTGGNEAASAAAKQDKVAVPKPRSRRGARTSVAALTKTTDAGTSPTAADPANKAEEGQKPQTAVLTQSFGETTPEPAARDHTADALTLSAPSGDEADNEDGEQPAQRKSRRGRRGGRGRNRKSRQTAQDADQNISDGTDVPLSEFSDAQPVSPGDMDMDIDSQDDEDEAVDAVSTPETPARARGRKDSAKKTPKGKEKEKEIEADNKPGRRKMFISVVPGEQVEVALVEEGIIGEYYLDMLHQAKTKGNIYKGVVHNVDPNLQAAFVNYGGNKNGFLQIDEIHTEYYLAHHEVAKGKKYPPIQKVIKPGQEVLVQVVKEPTGNKGAFLTTWLSLAGRFLVLTPGQEQIGVSRKVDNDEERARLREMMNGIEPGEGLGVIVRTVSAGTSKTTLKNDLQYLKRVWKEIRRRGTAENAPNLVYQESSLAERAVRDYLTEDVCEVWVDNESVAESLRETVALLFPRKEDLVRVHADVRQTLWERFNIQRQLEQIYSREVTLPSGGRLVFDQTEALMAIDINSGKISGKANFESMALKTNIEAAEAIARHLKLRDIGGQIVIDFIEMRDKSHVREVEKTLRSAMKNDRARHDVARMSSFGLLEIVRQRTGSSALAVTMEPCPCCNGTGIRRNMEWQSLQALRQVGRQARTPGTTRCVFEANAELGMYLLNYKRDRLREMEQQLNIPIEIRIQP